MNPKKKAPKTSESPRSKDPPTSESEVKVDWRKLIGSVMPAVGTALTASLVSSSLRELTAAVLTYTYCSNASHFYQSEVWDLFSSYLKGLETPPPEEDEKALDL